MLPAFIFQHLWFNSFIFEFWLIVDDQLIFQIDCHFHYLDIQSVDSKDSTHFSIITNDRAYSFVTSGDAGNFSSVRKVFGHLLSLDYNEMTLLFFLSSTWFLPIRFHLLFCCCFIRQDADVIVTDLASAIKQIFPTVPLKYIIRKVSHSFCTLHLIFVIWNCSISIIVFHFDIYSDWHST